MLISADIDFHFLATVLDLPDESLAHFPSPLLVTSMPY